jgi:hypothetical protein
MRQFLYEGDKAADRNMVVSSFDGSRTEREVAAFFFETVKMAEHQDSPG